MQVGGCGWGMGVDLWRLPRVFSYQLSGEWVSLSACDPQGYWYDACVVAERNTGDSREIKVHYAGWNKRYDEWLVADGPRVLGVDDDLPAQPAIHVGVEARQGAWRR